MEEVNETMRRLVEVINEVKLQLSDATHTDWAKEVGRRLVMSFDYEALNLWSRIALKTWRKAVAEGELSDEELGDLKELMTDIKNITTRAIAKADQADAGR